MKKKKKSVLEKKLEELIASLNAEETKCLLDSVNGKKSIEKDSSVDQKIKKYLKVDLFG